MFSISSCKAMLRAPQVGYQFRVFSRPSSMAFFTASSMVSAGCRSVSASSRRPSSSLVPVSRTTMGTLMSIRLVASMMPLATSSQRVMPPKMLKRMAFTSLSAEDDVQRVDDLLGVRAAADVQEVGGLAAVVLDQVHGGHGQAGAVDQAADVALELDEAEVRPRGPGARWGPRPRGRACSS